MTHEDEIWAALGLPDKTPPREKPTWPFAYCTSPTVPAYYADVKYFYYTTTATSLSHLYTIDVT